MRTNDIINVLLIWVVAVGCSMPKYLPKSEDVGVNQFGAYISVDQKLTGSVNGELISVGTDSLLVLEEKTNKCVYVVRSRITCYDLRYAKSINYAYVIPLGLLTTISHGYFAIITIPFNLIIGSAVAISSMNAFTYDQKDVSYEDLRLFARFPQGIPSDVDCNKLIPASPAK